MNKPRLVLFDLDNTLLNGDSDFEWAQFLIEQGVLDREIYQARNQQFYDAYKAGTLDIHAFLDFQLKPLATHSRIQLEAWRRKFIEEKIKPLISPKARALVTSHTNETTISAIITATNSFVTRPIADELGIPNLIATEPEQIGEEFTGKVAGIPCFREGKVHRLDFWLQHRQLAWSDLEESWFYSDSLNDIPLLNKVTHPVAVDPDDTLCAYAKQHAWPIISLR